MNATHSNVIRRRFFCPAVRARAALFALLTVSIVGALLSSSAVYAQVSGSSPQPKILYIAESENESLNLRMKDLLESAFGDTVVLRSFRLYQASSDDQSPVITLGPQAFNRVRQENQEAPVLALLVDQHFSDIATQQEPRSVSAIYYDQPLERQAAMGKAILPQATQVSMLASPETRHFYEPVLKDLEQLGLQGRIFVVPSDNRLIQTLVQALNYGDFILAAPDRSIYNPRTIKHILLTAYRRNRIVIGPSQVYVKAGSLASTFTPLSEIANMAAGYIREFWKDGYFPDPARPLIFGIDVNRQVGRSLNIPLPGGEALLDAVTRRLGNKREPQDD